MCFSTEQYSKAKYISVQLLNQYTEVHHQTIMPLSEWPRRGRGWRPLLSTGHLKKLFYKWADLTLPCEFSSGNALVMLRQREHQTTLGLAGTLYIITRNRL